MLLVHVNVRPIVDLSPVHQDAVVCLWIYRFRGSILQLVGELASAWTVWATAGQPIDSHSTTQNWQVLLVAVAGGL